MASPQSRMGGMVIANNSRKGLNCSLNEQGVEMEQDLAAALRERALSALEVSTTMLTVSENLLRQGNQREAARLRNEARYKRNESILLMDQAVKAEGKSGNVLRFPSRKPPGTVAETESSLPERRRFRRG